MLPDKQAQSEVVKVTVYAPLLCYRYRMIMYSVRRNDMVASGVPQDRCVPLQRTLLPTHIDPA